MNSLLKLVTGLIIGLILSVGIRSLPTQPVVGTELPQIAAVFETSLQTGISSSATSMTLTANSIRGGGSLSGFSCFTVDEGSVNAETICGTVSGTSVTLLERGISQSTGTTTVSALQFSHRRGANVKITDFPIIQRLKAQNAGEDTFANLLSYSTTTAVCTGVDQLCDKAYIDTIANAGAATATESVGGISELATQIEMASSTDSGTSNPLVLQAKYSTSSPDIRGIYNIISQTNGYLKQTWLDLTETFAWSGVTSFAATSTFNSGVDIDADKDSPLVLNNIEYTYPIAGGASSTVLMTDGSGNFTFNPFDWRLLEATTTQNSMAIASSTGLDLSKDIRYTAIVKSTSAAVRLNLRFNSDAASNYGHKRYVEYGTPNVQSGDQQLVLGLNSTTSPRYVTINISNLSSTRKLVSWTIVSNDSGTNAPGITTGSGVWNNTSEQINAITLFVSSGNISSGTEISIYGRR